MYSDIPQELQALPQWVVWSYAERNGKATKVPRQAANGNLASVTSSDTWCDFHSAVSACMEAGFSGIGFVFTESDPYVGIDIDHGIEADLADWFGSYTETTPSGNGLHIIVKGELPDGGRKSKHYEAYDTQRFFTMTGDVFRNNPIITDPLKLAEFMQVFPARNDRLEDNVEQGEPAMRDDEVISAVRRSVQHTKFELLWSGDWASKYPSQSEADGALLSILRFWTGGHKAQALALFGKSQLAQRAKWERTAYQESSWRVINRGPVRDLAPATSIRVPMFLRKATAKAAGYKTTQEVRDTTEQAAREALEGTVLETIVQVLERVTDPPLPLALTLPKAYVLIAGALTGRTSNPLRSVAQGRGVDLAKVVIDTAGGQACNVYALTIAESASGKDIGSLVPRICAKRGWHVGGTGSAEGFLDVLATKPTAVMEIGEFQNWLDQRHWQSKAAPTVTDMFNKYWFEMHLSQRGENTQARQTNYCALSIAANVQPGVMQRFSDRVSLDSGFLNRFLLCQCTDNTFRYPQRIDTKASMKLIEDALVSFDNLEGRLSFDVRENFSPLVAEFGTSAFAPHWKRLINEYGPRLSLMLTPQSGTIPTINEEGVRRASVLVRWHYLQALDVFKWFEKDDKKWETFVVRVFKAVQKRAAGGKAVSRTSIAHSVGGAARQRNEALEELCQRGFLEESMGGKYKVIDEPREWRGNNN